MVDTFSEIRPDLSASLEKRHPHLSSVWRLADVYFAEDRTGRCAAFEFIFNDMYLPLRIDEGFDDKGMMWYNAPMLGLVEEDEETEDIFVNERHKLNSTTLFDDTIAYWQNRPVRNTSVVDIGLWIGEVAVGQVVERQGNKVLQRGYFVTDLFDDLVEEINRYMPDQIMIYTVEGTGLNFYEDALRGIYRDRVRRIDDLVSDNVELIKLLSNNMVQILDKGNLQLYTQGFNAVAENIKKGYVEGGIAQNVDASFWALALVVPWAV